ncbi:MarR family winged helix-turn-helix transcriptional regulator [Microbacterium sp. SORGH_AS_0888]|uniref:MarR family winged helix-turn-helix transcriptional regulator n=1 Tax=Microbacterium sp. SORGH_AS_0888 TaxID=3041791 RepID=UPI002781D649|nr:MarR family transcriptional regulator [Microbacterium sp. SORGH_AS_0888]MDQ1129789.1 DNA-binding MarR family transcriptional regulator [Microbacterium sp. SORGH_AS_0888]
MPGDEEELLREAWQAMVAAVFEERDEWRRAVSEATGLPFTRVRVLRRVEHEPRSLGELARSAGMDAPATSVAVSALEERGYVVRESAPHDRRVKRVRITDAGREVLERMRAVEDPPPDRLRRATPAELKSIIDLLRP